MLFEDIKVYCFVSCLCECIKVLFKVDYCFFYFGVWDVEVVVNKDYMFVYYDEFISYDFFI